jgi:3',5'-cyclic-AMP phosphodiesterase
MERRSCVIVMALVCLGCLEYSPHALPSDDLERDLHRKALERLQSIPAPETLRFAVVGDTQTRFDHAKDAVESINRRGDVSLVVQLGDFVHFGLLPEYRAMNDVFRRLHVPYFVVVGTHDVFANGRYIYAEMFGSYDLAFTYGRTRFVLYNVNSRFFGFDGTVPDLGWIAGQIAPGPDHDLTVLFAHHDHEAFEFDPALREPFLEVLRNGRVDLMLQGHAHELRASELEGIPVYVADAVNARGYFVVTAHPEARLEVEWVRF